MPRSPSRSLARLTALLAAALFAAACVEIPTFVQQPSIVLRVAVPDATQETYLSERLRAFEREYPYIRIEVFNRLGTMRSNLASAISTLSTGTNSIDVVYLTDQDFQSLSDPNVLADLTPYLRERADLLPQHFYPMALPAFQNRGRQLALPTELVPLVVYYNRDLFEGAQLAQPTPDWTMRDFLLAARRLTGEQPGRQPTIGFVADPVTTVWPFVLAHGGEFPNPGRDPTARALLSPASLQGFQWFADLIVRDKVLQNQPG